MFKSLTISFVLVLLVSTAAAQSRVPSGPATLVTDDRWTGARLEEKPSSREPYSEAKRLYREGVKYALAGLFSQAAQLFERAVKLDPSFADAHFALGHAYADLRRWQNAIDSFQQAIDLNPNDDEARDHLQYARTMLAQEGKPMSADVTPAKVSAAPAAERISLNVKSTAATVPVAESTDNEAKGAAD